MGVAKVCRVYDPSEDIVDGVRVKDRLPPVSDNNLICFGLWKVCDRNGSCGKVWSKLTNVRPVYVIWVQTLAIAALLGYGLAIVMDAASRVSLLMIIPVNRIVEFCMAFSAVLHFLAMLHFTGQVKNPAVRVHRVSETAGWGFAMTATSLALALVSITIMALFRLPPGKHKHRRFWKLPAELRPRPYLASATVPPANKIIRVKKSSASDTETGGGLKLNPRKRSMEK